MSIVTERFGCNKAKDEINVPIAGAFREKGCNNNNVRDLYNAPHPRCLR